MEGKKVDSKDVRLFCYLLFNSPEMNKVLTRDFKENEKQNVTPTFYASDDFQEIVYRLLVNQDFKNLSDEDKKKLIFTNYYPEESKVLESVYLDDRRGLCQEFHNRLCIELKIPKTCVIFSDFTKNMDEKREYYYDLQSGSIFINTRYDFSKQDNTYLLEVVTQATYQHKLQMMINELVKNSEELSAPEKYVCNSTLLKESVLASLSENKYESDDRKALEVADEYCASDVYAMYSSYNLLEEIFEKLFITNNPILDNFNERRALFMQSLVEDYSDEEDEFDCEDESEECEEDAYLSEGVLMDTLGYDYVMLSEIKNSNLNKKTDGDLFKIFISKLEENSDEFYGSMGTNLGENFYENFQTFIKEEMENSGEASEEM